MALTFEELRERLARWDELDILEALGITSEDLVAAFGDRIEERFEKLEKEVDE